MTTYNTGNTLGSVDVRDLYDNAQNADNFSNGPLDAYPDRFGVSRQSLQGIRNASQYQVLGAYAAGLQFTSMNQVFSYLGEFYAPGPSITLPYTTTGVGAAEIANFRSVGDAILRGDLADDTDPAKGASQIGRAVQCANSVASLRTIPTLGPSKYAKTLGYYEAGDGGGGDFYASQEALVDDGGSIIAASGGGFWVLKDRAKVNVMQFGAIQGDDTQEVADINNTAFRSACLSYKSKWDAWKVGKQSRSVYVPPGDYNLSNGFAIPPGCAIFSDGLGVSRLRVMNATADVVAVLPLVTIGSVINDATEVLESSTGAYVNNPAPQIDNIYLNPQNSGTALFIKDMPGFNVGKLWVQAQTAVHVSGSGDGVFGDLVIESDTGTGVFLENSQNLMFSNIYTFLVKIGVELGSGNNNIHIANMQANYTEFYAVGSSPGSTNRSVSIGHLIVNQNAQFANFAGGLRLAGAAADVSVGTLECRNANGFAALADGVNELTIGTLKLKQLIGNPAYTQGNTLQGVYAAGNAKVDVGAMFSEGLHRSAVYVTGTPTVSVHSGRCRNFNAAVYIFDTSTASPGAVVEVHDFIGAASETIRCDLFAPRAGVEFRFRDIDDAFGFSSSGGRLAVFLPFNLGGEGFDVTLIANTNPAGNPNYRRVQRTTLLHETIFTASPVNHYTADTVAGPAGTVPVISLQIDYNAVGGGNDVAYAQAGYLVLSVPSTYTKLRISIGRA